jgi:hypothetical protein
MPSGTTCTTPRCHREAKVQFQGKDPFFRGVGDEAPVCIPCMAAISEGSGHQHNEVSYSIMGTVDNDDVDKIEEVLI